LLMIKQFLEADTCKGKQWYHTQEEWRHARRIIRGQRPRNYGRDR
jgi:hypothetical protein